MSRKSYSESESDYLGRLIDEYYRGHSDDVFKMTDIARWAYKRQKWCPPESRIIQDLARRLSRAAKSKRHKDPQGRLVRSLHAAKYPQVGSNGQLFFETLWDYMEVMSTEHARVSFTQRWQQIAGASKSLKTDINSFNDNNPRAAEVGIQLSFNFDGIVDQTDEPVVECLTPDEVDGQLG